MLAHIPTHVIGGPLGAGKTSLIRHLLAHKPAHERWAVLVNEFGQIGLDAALLATDEEGVGIAEIPGGCLCCVAGVPFQIGLARLLRKARPDRLLIEPSGLGHPLELLHQLGQAPWLGVLALQPMVLVLDAPALAAGQALPECQRDALGQAGLLLLNKAEDLDEALRARALAQLPARPLRWTDHGVLDFTELPGSAVCAGDETDSCMLPEGAAPLAQIWRDPRVPICQVQEQAEGWAIGWRFHPTQRFDRAHLQRWLGELDWRRAKAIVQGEDGWQSLNTLAGQALSWQASAWRRDSRVELIFAEAQSREMLEKALLACLVDD